MKLTLTSLTIGLSLSLLLGCGGGGVNSGVDPAKPANEVTDEEAEDVCQATADYAESKVSRERACTASAVAVGLQQLAGGDDAMQEACSEAYDQCVDAVETETDCSDASAEVTECDDTVTVGDVETCLQDQVDAGVAALDYLPSTCSELTLDYIQDLAENPPEEAETSAACETVYDGCPGFVTGE